MSIATGPGTQPDSNPSAFRTDFNFLSSYEMEVNQTLMTGRTVDIYIFFFWLSLT